MIESIEAMEHLTKQQLILLAILVSFVSSIATGIVTVTLMQQAPTGITQTINRVVEKTIEKVVPVRGPNISETRIIKEEDMVVAAIGKNSASVVRITTGADPGSGLSGDEIGNGIILSEDGFIATDAVVASIPEAQYYAETSDGKIFTLSRVSDKRGFTLFKVLAKEKTEPVKLSAASLEDSDSVKVGQTSVSMGDSVATGIVAGLSYERADGATTTPKTLSAIHSSTNPRDASGAAVMNLDGNIMGMVAVRGGTKITIPSNILKDALAEAAKSGQ